VISSSHSCAVAFIDFVCDRLSPGIKNVLNPRLSRTPSQSGPVELSQVFRSCIFSASHCAPLFETRYVCRDEKQTSHATLSETRSSPGNPRWPRPPSHFLNSCSRSAGTPCSSSQNSLIEYCVPAVTKLDPIGTRLCHAINYLVAVEMPQRGLRGSKVLTPICVKCQNTVNEKVA